MMLLVGLAIRVAFVASWGATLGLLDPQLDFWWELALLIVIMLLGHWIEMRWLAQTTSAFDSLAALLPDEAERVDGGEVVTVAPTALRVGDVVVVRPGGSVPADGVIVDGRAEMDESMVTGESRTVPRGTGERVTAGTVATDSGLRVEVTATGDDTALAGIQRLVAAAQSSSSRAQRIADRAAAWLFWFALGAAAITAVVWSVAGDRRSGRAHHHRARHRLPPRPGPRDPARGLHRHRARCRAGVLVKDRLALESMRTVDVVLFDKTGTLTTGRARRDRHRPADPDRLDASGVLALAAAAETDSEHPLARPSSARPRSAGSRCPRRGFQVVARGGRHRHGVRARGRVGGPWLLEEAGRTEAVRRRRVA